MVLDFYVVLLTGNLSEQVKFYQDVLGLELVFDTLDAKGLGKDNNVFIILKKEDLGKSHHHAAEYKGPSILTFKCQGDIKYWTTRIKNAGFKVRAELSLQAYNASYLFVEDYDSNEVCLEFREAGWKLS